ncbi:MAG: hypothetical protein H0V17_20225, partial [Deltaproteobacteria bacterium]|nr:hypothetical protein [Deltaproteobacteria bacterium]
MLFAVILAAGRAEAKKDKIAILGLEVLGTTTVDSESTRVAQDLTVALRTRPKAGQGPYQWTPGSEKELVDEKIMNNCPNEDKDCMAKIGAALGADFLVYGKIERKQLGGQAGYQISLKLLKVGDGKPGNAQSLPGWTEFIPLAESSGTKLQEWARKGYKKLTNDFDGGTLKIRVRNEGFDRGTILVEGEERGNITAGSGEVPSLPEGRYKISIVAGGFERWDSTEKITIRNGETTTEEITLTAAKTIVTPGCDPAVSNDCGGTVSQAGSGRGFWRGMFVVGAVVAAGGGGLLFVAGGKVSDAKDANSCEDDVACLKTKGFDTPDERNDSGKKFETLSYVAGGVLAVGGTL